MFGGSSRFGAAALQLVRASGTAVRYVRSADMTIVPDQGRARGLYDEQLQRQQQEKILMSRAREGRPDLLDLPPHR